MKLIIFISICLVEAIILYLKWGTVSDAHEAAKIATSVSGIRVKYNDLVSRIVSYLKQLKPLMWLVVILLLVMNYMLAVVLTFVIKVIALLYFLIF
jgi:hypothetical protein